MTTRNRVLHRRQHTRAEQQNLSYELSETVAVLTSAVEANEKQINEVNNNLSRNIRDVASLMKDQGAQLSAKIEALGASFQASRVTNWPVVISALVAVGMFVGAAYKITDLQTQVTMSPIASKADVGERDRQNLKTDVLSNQQKINNIEAQQKVIDAKLKEVETQFKAGDQSRNTQFAEQQRVNNLIMQMAQGAKPIQYPEGPYFFPTITDSKEQ